MTTVDDTEFLMRAAKIAARGLYTTDPNPRVGCILTKDGNVVGEGWHELAGGPHAERIALSQAGEAAFGATAYVTLEPCNFEGRTGACTEALIEAKVARVVCSGIDPTPEVAGKGIASLREAGIKVDVGIVDDTITELNAGFFSRLTRGRPFVRSKIAVSLDGRTALANGESQWITGDLARLDVHRWRARSSAILTSVSTVLADDPSLDARLEAPAPPIKQPLIVVLDSDLRTPTSANVVMKGGEVSIFTTDEDSPAASALRKQEVSIEQVGRSRGCDLEEVFSRLSQLQINEVWVEAGAILNGALIRQGLIDELIVYIAPQIFGDTARGMFVIDELFSLEQSVSFEFKDVRRVGDDLRIIASPSNVSGPQLDTL